MKNRVSGRAGLFVPGLLLLHAIAAYPQLPIAIPDGYATGTTGGAGGQVTTVTSGPDFKSACESSGARIILVKGNLGDVGQISCKSDKTISGFDTTAGFRGNLSLSGVSNIIIQNLTISNPNSVGTADGIEATSGCTKIFVTKCTFNDCADGSYDIKRGSDFLTVSWCRFRYPSISGHNFANLIGHDDANGAQDRGKLHITMHHNWYDAGSDQRMPRVRFGTVHVYNNYYGCSGNTYCIGTGFECHIRVESCVFENVNKPWDDIDGMANGGEIGWSNLTFSNASAPTYAPNRWPVFTPPYDFNMDPPGSVKAAVTHSLYGAGNRLAGEQFSLAVTVGQGQGTVTPQNGNFLKDQRVTITATPAAQWLFDHWSGDLTGNDNPATVTMTANKTIAAHFVEDSREYYSVTALAAPGGSIAQTPEGSMLPQGTRVTLTAVPDHGWTFTGWSGDHTGTNAAYTVSSLQGPVALLASFLPVDKFNYEAEYAAMNDADSESVNSGFSGQGYVNFLGIEGSLIKIPVYTDIAGAWVIAVTFANGSGSTRPLSFSVNDTQQIASQDFEATTEWTTWQSKQIVLVLPRGASTITLSTINGKDGPNVDKITLVRTGIANARSIERAGGILSYTMTRNHIHITAVAPEQVNATLFTLDGKRVPCIMTSKRGIMKIPVSGLENGMYLIRLECNGTTETGYVKVMQ